MPSASTSSLPFSPAELSYLHTSLSSIPPIRPDSRTSTDFRPLNAETGILPATNGSAHVSFSDGSEAIVGIKLEVEKSSKSQHTPEARNGEQMELDTASKQDQSKPKGRPDWITFMLTLPGLRDDDSQLVFLEEMLREPLLTPSSIDTNPSLADKLVINSRWHWHIYIDVLLISPQGLASYPLPLLSMSTYLALRNTRVPRLKSEGEEDPSADDDWMASTYIYTRTGSAKPPVTLLVIAVGDNILFDPSHEELKVADAILAISIGSTGRDGAFQMLAMRTIDNPARDTMKGVPKAGAAEEGAEHPGVWRPRMGGIKRTVLKNVVKAVLTGGVAEDVVKGLDGFLKTEQELDARSMA
jgi:exosome complex component RRP42